MKLSNIFLASFAFAGFAAAKTPGSRRSAKELFEELDQPVRLILTDIDGTLSIQDSKDFVSRNALGFAKAPQLGIPIGVATGRNIQRALGFFKDDLKSMNYNGSPGAYYAGCYVLGPNGEVLLDKQFPKEFVKGVVEEFDKKQMLPRVSLMKLTSVVDGIDIKKAQDDSVFQDIYQIRFGATPEVLIEMRTLLESKFKDAEYSWTADGALELGPRNCNKGIAVQLIAESMGIPIESVVVVGNGENDRTMFSAAGISVAVQDSAELAIEAADCVGAHTRDGPISVLVDMIEELGKHPLAIAKN